jgi:molybdenum cofactor synthesis domain-containing protein
MLAYEDALALITRTIKPGPVARLPLYSATGCAVARDIKARLDMPGFDNSAMDGYGVYVADTVGASARRPAVLTLASESRAGGAIPKKLKPGQAVRIFTGAPVPRGVEAVVIQEQCETVEGAVRIRTPAQPGQNIRKRGEEYKRGATLFARGTRVTPAVISVLASQGYKLLPVRGRPRVAVVTSGDELAAAGERLARGQIYDSNTPGLLGALTQLGISARSMNVADRLSAAKKQLSRALAASDFVLVAGGISVGDYDVIRTALGEAGVRQVYWQLAIKPGKPNYFGVLRKGGERKHDTYVFGLPGNPVSALVSFLKLVRPGLARHMGTEWQPLRLPARLTSRLSKKPGRLEWVRARLVEHREGLRVTPLAAQGSHMLGGLAQADCLIDFPCDTAELAVGSSVMVEVINYGP